MNVPSLWKNGAYISKCEYHYQALLDQVTIEFYKKKKSCNLNRTRTEKLRAETDWADCFVAAMKVNLVSICHLNSSLFSPHRSPVVLI